MARRMFWSKCRWCSPWWRVWRARSVQLALSAWCPEVWKVEVGDSELPIFQRCFKCFFPDIVLWGNKKFERFSSRAFFQFAETDCRWQMYILLSTCRFYCRWQMHRSSSTTGNSFSLQHSEWKVGAAQPWLDEPLPVLVGNDEVFRRWRMLVSY